MSESNYQYLEDDCVQHTTLISYGTVLKENKRKWKNDDSTGPCQVDRSNN